MIACTWEEVWSHLYVKYLIKKIKLASGSWEMME